MFFDDAARTGRLAIGKVGKKMAVILLNIRILVTAWGDHKIDVTVQVGIAVVGAIFNNGIDQQCAELQVEGIFTGF
jgi:hypothetical protein